MLVVDDHALLRTGVANIINHEPDLTVVAEAANGLEALAAFDRYRPDVILLDLRMPEMDGVEVVRQIRARDPQAKVIVLTTYDTDDDIERALKAGAKAYILKDIAADALIACIHDVLAGKTYLAPAAAAKLADSMARVQLTPRELATLRLTADGRSNKEIAAALGISEPTWGTCSDKCGRRKRSRSQPPRSRRADRLFFVRRKRPLHRKATPADRERYPRCRICRRRLVDAAGLRLGAGRLLRFQTAPRVRSKWVEISHQTSKERRGWHAATRCSARRWRRKPVRRTVHTKNAWSRAQPRESAGSPARENSARRAAARYTSLSEGLRPRAALSRAAAPARFRLRAKRYSETSPKRRRRARRGCSRCSPHLGTSVRFMR